MAVTIKRVTLWRTEVENRPGSLATTLEPLANAGGSLQVVMAYRYPGNESRAAVELCPVSGKRVTAAAQAAGLGRSAIPTLLVQGDDKLGLGHAIARALAEQGINIGFLVAQVIGRKFSAVYGFESDAEAAKASMLIRKAAAPPKRAGAKRK